MFRIEQVITNLLTNALRYGNEKPITVELNAEAEKVIFKVVDKGIGIKEEDRRVIFEQFERGALGTPHKEGLGLGLYIVKQILDAHHASISVTSKVGEGSCFSIELPRSIDKLY